MSMDPDWVRYAVLLATGEALTVGEAEELARRLSVREEVLPHVVLRRDGFASAPRVRAALRAAAESAPPMPATRRAPSLADRPARLRAENALAEILHDYVTSAASDTTLSRRAEQALRLHAEAHRGRKGSA